MAQSPAKTSTLRLDKTLYASEKELKAVRDNLSAIAIDGANLWLGGDEGTSIHRMSRDSDGNYGGHRSFDLRSLLKPPIDDPGAEIDIEGLDVNAGYLWLIGSHSLKRTKPEPDKTVEENIQRLAKSKLDGNRFTLGRLPLEKDGADFKPVSAMGTRTAARLQGDAHSNMLTDALASDAHLGEFVPRVSDGKTKGIPSKDNGLDIEGLAVLGERVFVGLRGPVMRGWAIILSLQVGETSPDRLKLQPTESSAPLYRKHFLELDGLGVRDITIEDKDIFILAGPTMNLDGPVFLYRWRNALDHTSDSLIGREALQRVLSLPCGNEADKTEGKDHPEGIALLRDPLSVVVCYDSPSKARIVGPDKDGIKADIFML